MQTAKIAMGTGLADIRQDARLAEITMGQWTGRLRSEVAQEVPHLFEGQSLLWYDHAPEGEGLDKLAGRASDFLDHVTGPSIVVTHGITSRVLRCLAMGLPVSEFASVGGGQGVVYHVSEGTCRLLKTGEGGTEID